MGMTFEEESKEGLSGEAEPTFFERALRVQLVPHLEIWVSVEALGFQRGRAGSVGLRQEVPEADPFPFILDPLPPAFNL